jgi:hypothetical protein
MNHTGSMKKDTSDANSQEVLAEEEVTRTMYSLYSYKSRRTMTLAAQSGSLGLRAWQFDAARCYFDQKQLRQIDSQRQTFLSIQSHELDLSPSGYYVVYFQRYNSITVLFAVTPSLPPITGDLPRTACFIHNSASIAHLDQIRGMPWNRDFISFNFIL